ncbi:hypothetical protein Scep_014127 [Stephania cephalantha]|uniref:Uncharacterized protein n=1 Tax=Stephania cephalantha TaxID=152367 RepID=A0AAP0J379_9MAGN
MERSQLRHIERGVEGEIGRQIDNIGVVIDFALDRERAKAARISLLLGTCWRRCLLRWIITKSPGLKDWACRCRSIAALYLALEA